MPLPSVAVVIPCYNTRAFVSDAIDSVLRQTYARLEIVVVNDGSTDGSADVVQRYADRITIVHQDNRGLAAARNRGIDASTSPLIAFLDADDRWAPHKIEAQVRLLLARPEVSLVFCDRAWIDGEGQPAPPPAYRRPAEPTLRSLVNGNFIQPSTVLLRREALGRERFAAGMTGTEDWDLWLRLAERCTFDYIDAPLVEYRLHGANMSSRQEVMTRGFVTVLERALARNLPADVRAAAESHRRALLADLGHHAYDRSDWSEARRLFTASGIHRSHRTILRWMVTALPAPVRNAVQAARAGVLRAGYGIGGRT